MGRPNFADLRIALVFAVLLAITALTCGTEEDTADAGKDVVDVAVEVAEFEAVEAVDPDNDDPDGDGYATAVELNYGTDPYNADSTPPDVDGDKVPDPEDDDIDGDGVANGEDSFPYNPAETADFDGDGTGDVADTDDDNDGYSDQLETEHGTDPLDAGSSPPDLDGDGLPDSADNDIDGDGVANDDDAFPEQSMEWADADDDGLGDNGDDDDDNDGYSDDLEAKYGTGPKDPQEFPADLDGDGIPDGEDLDLDGDGVDNSQDAFPQDPAESADTDGDGEGDTADVDDDGDGYPDATELKYGADPLSAESTPADLDNDLLPDEEDSDIDGDQVQNDEDAFPKDAAEWADTDGDGAGNNADPDDDGDGYPDAVELEAGTSPLDPDSKPDDLDGDGLPDAEDLDIDGDDVLNTADAFPYDSAEWDDFDEDGLGDNADEDDDGDGYPDDVEANLGTDPLNANSHPADLDGDGVPDSQDDDIDGDGVANESDIFPLDPEEAVDTDGDGSGDNGDKDDDNDGYLDEQEAELQTDPKDPDDKPADLDQDYVPDALDDDVDGDGVPNTLDAFPADPTEVLDTDGDGQGDNADTDDDDDGYPDVVEEELGTDPGDPAVHPSDLDGDGTPDPSDPDLDGDGADNGDDAFPYDGSETVDTDDDGKGDNADTDDDGDGYPDDVEIDAKTDPKDKNSYPDDIDGDGIPDLQDPDADGDGVPNDQDAFDKDPKEWLDTDGDGIGNGADPDDDGDGFADTTELLFSTDPLSPFSFPSDLDGDKIPDALDPDRDGDGILNEADAFPNDATEWLDTDGDGLGNQADDDDDGDGFADDLEVEFGFDPLDFGSHPGDLDGDGIADLEDPDIDGDGILNDLDVFPINPTEWEDTDSDGIGNNGDGDDDGDGYPDVMEIDYLTDPLDWLSVPPDLDKDLIPDAEDLDIDGDLMKNDQDAFPEDPAEWFDTDQDGLGNNADPDDDDDGYLDMVEAQYKSDPLDPWSFPPDIDGDLIPDPEDTDKDGDGVPNIDDAFPSDPDAWEEVMEEGSFGEDYQDSIPPDADPLAFDTKRFSLVRGLIVDIDNVPFEGVSVSILGHPEYGSVQTNADGEFTIPVNGGLTLTLVFLMEGFTQAQRFVEVPWNDMVVLPQVELISYDPVETEVFLTGDEEDVVVHTSVASEHPITVAFSGDNLIVAENEDGELEITDNIVITATEYENPDQMPGELPATTEYTYCVDVKAEGYDNVEFDKPVMLWTKDFLGFEVGSLVPVGYYDRDVGKWLPMEDGLVVELLDEDDDGVVDAMDWDGDGLPDDMNEDGNFTDEVVGIEMEPDALPGDIYWRVAVTHFSPLDLNYPGSGPPPDATAPPDDGFDAVRQAIEDRERVERCFRGGNSEIDIRGRVMHETIPVPGTDFALHYSSEWVEGHLIPLDIPASPPEVPDSLSDIEVVWSIAGLRFSETLAPAPNQEIHWVWDGRDFMGNMVNQRMNLSVEVGWTYPAFFYASPAVASQVGASFAAMGVEATNINTRQPVTLWRTYDYPVYHYRPETPADAWGVGHGWTPDVFHYYDGTSQSVLLGTGEKIQGDQFGYAVSSVGGALPTGIRSLDVDSDGVIYYLPKGNTGVEKTVMRMEPGKSPQPYVTMANRVGDISVGPDDELYLTTGAYLWKVPRATANPYILASLYLQFFNCFAYYGDYCLLNVDVDQWGYAFLVSRYPVAFGNSKMAIVAPDGTVLANPVDLKCTSFDVGVAEKGQVVAACKNGPVKKVVRDGSVETFPGWAPMCEQFYGYTDPSGIAVLRDGAVLMADQACNRIRKVMPDGTVTVIAGTGESGFAGDDGAPLAAQFNSPSDVAYGPDGAIYVADSGNKRIRKIEQVRSVIEVSQGEYGVPLANGQILIFGEKLEHLETRDMISGVVKRQFAYNDLGQLAKETTASGEDVLFEHDGKGRIVKVVGFDSQETELAYDPDGNLVLVQFADGSKYQFEYNDDHLLTQKLDPGGNEYEYFYDDTGRIIEVKDPAGGWTKYDEFSSTNVVSCKTTTAEGKVTKYEDIIGADGNWSTLMTNPAGGVSTFAPDESNWSEEAILPDGTLVERRYDVDPKYGTRYLSRETETTPSGLTRVTQNSRSYDDAAGLVYYVRDVNGKSTTATYDIIVGTITTTSPTGRSTEVTYDVETGMITSSTTPTVLSSIIEYDDFNRPETITQGERVRTMTYDDAGRVASVVGPLGDEYKFEHGLLGQMAKVTRPDESTIEYQYDPAGLLSAVIGPDGSKFTYSRTQVEDVNEYETPGGLKHVSDFNLDREWIATNLPSGDKVDAKVVAGLLEKLTVGNEQTTYTYLEDGSGKVADAESYTGVKTNYQYDGSLVTQENLAGPIVGSVGFTYDDGFRKVGADVAGTDITFAYDADGLLTKSGALTLERDLNTGEVAQVTDGSATLVYGYNGHGEVDSIEWKFGGESVYQCDVERNAGGKIVKRTQTIDGDTVERKFDRDVMGQVVSVLEDGQQVESYEYDVLANRTTADSPGLAGSQEATFGDDNRMTHQGAWEFTYDGNARLASMALADGSQETLFNYSAAGELRDVILPDGTEVSYLYDAYGRMAVRLVDGEATDKYLYYDQMRPAAILNADDSLRAYFVYSTRRVPIYMQEGDDRYYFITDDIGSVRMVVDQDGETVQQIDYDAFGTIVSLLDPEFDAVFGFAGGLADTDTGLVRFRFREYAPKMGRWTAPDPIGPAQHFNPYVYVNNDPVGITDPLGLGETADEVKKIVEDHGLPGKVIPDNVADYKYDEKTGKATIKLKEGFKVDLPKDEDGNKQSLTFGKKLTCTISDGKITKLTGLKYSGKNNAKIHTIENVKEGVIKLTGSGFLGIQGSKEMKVDELPDLPPKK